jgi:Putative Actinobacterial Holin-X, holin superfamily III
MSHERLRYAAAPVTEVVADLADLSQKELRLASAELSAKLSAKLHAGIWMSVAGVLGLIAGLVLIQAAIFAIASFGIALHWSCLIVAAALGAVALVSYLKGRADAREELTPARTIHQIKRDIATVKEQLT